MRIGQNPAKYVKEVAKPERITVAVLNYIPFVSGFYAEMPQVLQACLESLRRGADLPFDLLVFDNGSCPEVQQALLEQHLQGQIQYLFLSEHNLGKGGAWNVMLAGAPGEIIAYADNDCLFAPGWLGRSVQLLEAFPKVGMVTSRPFRTSPEYYSRTLEWAGQTPGVQMETGCFVPWQVINEFNLSLGQTEEDSRHFYETTQDVRLTYNGVSAFAGASHWQFVAKKEVLAQFLPFDMDRPMGQVKQLDQAMNQAGYLRLMPTEPFVMNMSNTLPADLQPAKTDAGRPQRSKASAFYAFPPVKRLLLSLYDSIFKIYYRS